MIDNLKDMSASGMTDNLVQLRFNPLFAFARDILLIVGTDGRIMEANQAAIKAYSYNYDEFKNLSIFDLRSSDDHIIVEKQLAEAAKHGVLFETVHRRKNGTTFPVEVSSQGANIGGQKVLLSIISDISKRKQAEEALKKSEARYRSMVETAREGIWQLDEENRTIYCNHSMAEMLGYTVEEMMGLDPLEVMGEKCRLRFAEIIHQSKSEPIRQIECKLRRQDGKNIWVIVSGTAAYTSGEQYAGFTGMFTDINERKRMEEDLRSSEEMFAKAFNSSPAAMSICTFPDGIFVNINEAFIRNFGYKREDVIGQTRWDLDLWENPEDLKSMMEIVHNKRSFHRFETTLRNQAGELRMGVLSADILQIRGAEYMLSVFEDITVRRNAEEKLKEQLAFLQTLIETIPIPVYFKSRDLIYQGCNNAFEVAIGKPKADVIGSTVYNINPKELANVFYDKDYELLANPGVQHYETRVRYADGMDHTVVFHKATYGDAPDQPSGMVGIWLDITEQKQAEDMLKKSYGQLDNILDQIVKSLASVIEIRDPYTAGHQVRVATLAAAIATELGLSENQIHSIKTAALLHDIGKIVIPSEILSKPGKLNDLEQSYIKIHPQAGYDIVKDIEFSFPIAEIIRQHHERLDGSGYPQGLTGDEIMLEAKIIAVADVVEAMASHRPYRAALSFKTTFDEIRTKKGILYDPEAVDACLTLFKKKGFTFKNTVIMRDINFENHNLHKVL